jgi:basic amino acid/polyamine antiporter, APA family
MGQPRIWMSMSRDGLLPKAFSKIHPKFKTPHISTIITGIVVVLPTLFMDLGLVTDLCSIGTLFAFVLVCAGVLMLEKRTDLPRGKFRTPYINSRFIMPALLIISLTLLYIYNKDGMMSFITNRSQQSTPSELVSCVSADEMKTMKQNIQITDSVGLLKANGDVEVYLQSMDGDRYSSFLETCSIDQTKKQQSGWALFKHKIPLWIFILCAIALTILCMVYALSLIPALGLISCLYMMAELGVSNWIGFGIWLAIGLVIYFTYSYKNSKLNTAVV